MPTLNPQDSSIQAKLVLIIEENSAVCDMLCSALETAHYRTATLLRWQEASVWAENAARSSELPILILLDLSTPPDLNASHMLCQFRTQWSARAGTTPPIIVLTTFEKIYNDLSANGESVLRKPFHVKDLLFIMSRLLSPSLGKKSI